MLPTEISRYGVIDNLEREFGGSFPVAASADFFLSTQFKDGHAIWKEKDLKRQIGQRKG